MENSVQDPRFRSDLVFNGINKQFITLKDAEMKEYNVHLQNVLCTFIERMKKTDTLFNACYQRIAYVGSYYEGLKVGKAEEFDLNIIINLPFRYKSLEIMNACEKPGYIKIKTDPDVAVNLRKHPRWPEYKKMDTWFDDNNNLDQNKFRQWFESVVTRAINSFEYVNGKHELTANANKYRLHHKKSGPAWTMKIDVPGGHTVDVDLVPALEFQSPPPKPFKNHKTEKQNWFAISKPLDGRNSNIMWRPSFYEREQEILKGKMKPVIRQMKKLRDTQNFKSIASYYIKTLFLHELEKQESISESQKFTSTYLFYIMLQKLRGACVTHEIFDFWNPKNNLLSNISAIEMLNFSSRLTKIIKEIEKRIATDPYVIAEFILSKDELVQLKDKDLSRLNNTMSAETLQTETELAEQAEGSVFSTILQISAVLLGTWAALSAE